DVVTTMLDEGIPLTTNEYDEWGNPADAQYYEYMLAYSPYDNVRPQAYPAMLVTTGLWDSQVQYYEPAKWVAKLRALKTDRNPLLLHVEMEAGHGGKSGRFQRYRETALEYAFLLWQLGITDDLTRTPKKEAPRAGEAKSRRQESTKGEKHKRSNSTSNINLKHQHSNHIEALIKIRLIRAASTRSIQPRGQAGGRGDSRIDSREGKLAVAAAHQQGGSGITFRDQHRDDLRFHLHDQYQAIRMPSRKRSKSQAV